MNIDATETDLRNAAEALKLAAILDDRAPAADRARIAAWAEKIHAHRLGRDELLDALQAFYDAPHDRAIGIGDLIDGARRIKRDRLDREPDTQREHRQDTQAAKANGDIDALADMAFGPTVKPTDRLAAAERALQCATDRATAMTAITEYAAARREARRGPRQTKTSA